MHDLLIRNALLLDGTGSAAGTVEIWAFHTGKSLKSEKQRTVTSKPSTPTAWR